MDRHGQTPLHLACQRGDVESARVIFESNTAGREIDLDAKNFEGECDVILFLLKRSTINQTVRPE